MTPARTTPAGVLDRQRRGWPSTSTRQDPRAQPHAPARNPDVPAQPLRLDGDELNLSRVMLGGQALSFRLDGQTLVLENLPAGDEPFELEIFTTCAPEKNSKLMGLFMSGGDFFTQCEARGLSAASPTS